MCCVTEGHAHAHTHLSLQNIDARKAGAREKKDLEAITRSIERTATFEHLNELASTRMKEWLVEAALTEEARLRELDTQELRYLLLGDPPNETPS